MSYSCFVGLVKPIKENMSKEEIIAYVEDFLDKANFTRGTTFTEAISDGFEIKDCKLITDELSKDILKNYEPCCRVCYDIDELIDINTGLSHEELSNPRNLIGKYAVFVSYHF
jgi:hypothetical protein